jgi:hypothetical protein
MAAVRLRGRGCLVNPLTSQSTFSNDIFSRQGFPPPVFNGISFFALEWRRKALLALIVLCLAFSNASPTFRQTGRIMTFTSPPFGIRRGPFR